MTAMRNRFSRRELLKGSTALAAATVFADPARAAAPAPSPITPALIEAARREGKVSFYTALELPVAERFGKVFEAKYPGIAVRVERSGAERIYQRIAQEQGSRINAVDIANSTDPAHYLDPKTRAEVWRREGMKMVEEGLVDREHYYGTIKCDGVNAKGEICGVTTTSGLAWKIPGRVGDSPILGAGLYVDGAVGAAGSTGRGEANLYNLCSFLIVEEMRHGRHPKDAGMEALRRIKANTVEKRLLNSKGNPNFGINFYIVNAKGEFAGVTMYPGASFAICNESGPQTLTSDALLSGKPGD